MDDFQGIATIEIQPNDAGLPYSFAVTACSAVDANDGAIPYGTNVVSVAVTATNLATGADVTDAMIEGTPTVAENVVSVNLNWPGAAGKCKLTFLLTLTGDIVRELDFTRITAVDK